jgi:hypothetical protein
MRARAAYISSLGTTGILVSSALLMLAMVSALVAFRAWPGGQAGADVQRIPIESSGATTLVSVHRAPVPSATRIAASRIAAAAKLIGGNAAAAGLRKEVPARGPSTIGSAPPMTPAPVGSGPSATRSSGPQKAPQAPTDPTQPPDPPAPPQLPSVPAPPDVSSVPLSTATGMLGGLLPPRTAFDDAVMSR